MTAAWRERLEQLRAGALQSGWERIVAWGAIRQGGARARRFAGFGAGSAIGFPMAALYGERYIRIGAYTVIGAQVSLSAGILPGHAFDHDVVTIGDGCVIGRGSGVVGHERITIGDHVFTGHNVYITDANHDATDPSTPIGRQLAPPRPVSIGEGSWLGHATIVLPGATIGRHVVVGAGSVVTGELPDFCVAVGSPARVIRSSGRARSAPGYPAPPSGTLDCSDG